MRPGDTSCLVLVHLPHKCCAAVLAGKLPDVPLPLPGTTQRVVEVPPDALPTDARPLSSFVSGCDCRPRCMVSLQHHFQISPANFQLL